MKKESQTVGNNHASVSGQTEATEHPFIAGVKAPDSDGTPTTLLAFEGAAPEAMPKPKKKRKSSREAKPSRNSRKPRGSARDKSTSRTPDLEQQREHYFHHLDTLDPAERQTIEHETAAAREACGSRLAVAKHLSKVHDILCRDLKNPRQKTHWTEYLRVTLPGLAGSRSQIFKDILAWREAKNNFPAPFLDAFFSSGYAMKVRPTVDDPLGKYTEPCKQILLKCGDLDMSAEQANVILSEAANSIAQQVKAKRDARKEERKARENRSADERRRDLLLRIHTSVIDGMKALAETVEDGETYTAINLRDDVEAILSLILKATGTTDIEVTPRPLPDGYTEFVIPASDVPRKQPHGAAVPASVESAAG